MQNNTRKALATEAPEPKPERIRDHAAEDQTRTKAQMKLRVRQEIIDVVDEAAGKANLNRSDYVEALILGQNIAPTPTWERASDNALLTIAGHRIMRMIAALEATLQKGEASPALDELQLIRREIVRGQLTLRPEYEAYLDDRSKSGDSWTDREAK